MAHEQPSGAERPTEHRDSRFDELDAQIRDADQQGPPAPPRKTKRNTGNSRRVVYNPTGRRADKAERPESDALAAAKEMATEAAQRIRAEIGERLNRDEFVQLANWFRRQLVPRRTPGRRKKAQITAAYLDWKAGMRGVQLLIKHVPGWQRHNRYRRMAEQRRLMDAIRSRARREHAKSIHSAATTALGVTR